MGAGGPPPKGSLWRRPDHAAGYCCALASYTIEARDGAVRGVEDPYPIPQIDRRRHTDAVQQHSRIGRIQHLCLAALPTRPSPCLLSAQVHFRPSFLCAILLHDIER